MLQLHPDACADFNRRADALMSFVAPPLPEHQFRPAARRHERPAFGTIGENQILSLEMAPQDGKGRTIARYRFVQGSGMRGFSGDGYRQFAQLARDVQNRAELQDVVSVRRVEALLFAWVLDRASVASRSEEQTPDVTGALGERTTFTEVMLNALENEVGLQEVLIPVPGVMVEGPIQLGRVTLKSITAFEAEAWIARLASNPEDAAYFRRRLDEVQGRAAAAFSVVAEASRAEELAFDAAEESLSILRLFAAETLHPYRWSLLTVEGMAALGRSTVIISRGEALSVRGAMPSGLADEWQLIGNAVTELLSIGLRDAIDLVCEPNPTEMERSLKLCLRHYSNVALKRDPAEKLLYVVSALEALLLGSGDKTSITQNFRERFAILMGKDAEERKKFLKLAGDVYEMRSRFVHGGIRATELKMIEEFMVRSWALLLTVLKNRCQFQSKDEFIQRVDLHKMAGPPFDPARIA